MCEACSDPTHLSISVPLSGRRPRLWELNGGWHCSIIGTCLTIADLRALAKKMSLKTRADFPIDYQLHGFFAQEAEKPSKAAKMLNKLLDKRHGAAVRKARALKSEKELEDFWAEAQNAGNIPGPYWAVLSHPAATKALSERMFADMHMLSHLVGASNRAGIRQLTAMEAENASQRTKFSKLQRRHQTQLREKGKLISDLRTELSELRKISADLPPHDPKILVRPSPSTPTLKNKISKLQIEKFDSDEAVREQRAQNQALILLVKNLREENASLEKIIVPENSLDMQAVPLDLEGRCLLYVGGRQPVVHRLRSLVEDWNGRFLHHDGGLEKSINELASAVGKADAVFFPTDCVSHEAALRVKRLCRQTMKPFVPLRTSGVASLVNRLKQGFGALHTSASAN